MKITFEEVLSGKKWVEAELLRSLPVEVIEKAMNDQFYEVKLLVNGIEVEPKFFNDLVGNIEKYVDDTAASLIYDKIGEIKEKLQNKMNKLETILNDASDELIKEMNLNPIDYKDDD